MERSARVSWGSSAWDRVAGGNAAVFFFAWLIVTLAFCGLQIFAGLLSFLVFRKPIVVPAA